MYWLHCNRCGKKPDKITPLFLTSCGHTYCRSCTAICSGNSKCHVCPNVEIRTAEINSSLKPELKTVFLDVVEEISNFQRIVSFQMGQYKHLVKSLQKRNNSLQEMLKVKEQEHTALRNEIKQLKAQTAPSWQSTPGNNNNGQIAPLWHPTPGHNNNSALVALWPRTPLGQNHGDGGLRFTPRSQRQNSQCGSINSPPVKKRFSTPTGIGPPVTWDPFKERPLSGSHRSMNVATSVTGIRQKVTTWLRNT